MLEEVDGVKLDPNNKLFFQAVEHVKSSNQNITYLTGKAGTGKTTFLKYVRQTYDGNVVVLAPTGVAAVNACGQTIHSFFNFELTPYPPGDQRLQKPQIYHRFAYKQEKLELIKSLSLLIIDEISMVRCDLLDAIDIVLRTYRKNQECFGGVKVLLIGDLFQLPPIATQSDWNILRQYYKSPYFFDSYVYKRAKSTYIELEKPYRQTEIEFIDLLNKVRVNQLSDDDLKILDSRSQYQPPQGSIILAPTNALVGEYNRQQYDALTTPEEVFYASTTGVFPASMKLVDDRISLKIGAQVMIMKNKYNKQSEAFEYCNGSIGTVTAIERGESVTVALSDKTVTIVPETWDNVEFIWDAKTGQSDVNIIGTYKQIPLRLAWAITINKSQGLTFDKVAADLNSCFDKGQVYVALSRCRKLSGLYLKAPLNKNVVKIDPNVLQFSQQKTPATMIVQEIEYGKADKLYKESRQAFDNNDAERMLSLFREAMKIRDDSDAPIFNKYLRVKLALFHHYKERSRSVWDALVSVRWSLAEMYEKFHALKNQNEGLISQIEQSKRELQELQKENNTLQQTQKEAEYQKAKLEVVESLLREQVETVKTELSYVKDQLQSAQNELARTNQMKLDLEIAQRETTLQLDYAKNELRNANQELERLRNLKWWQRLFGKR